jgi:hypothetical protein
MANHLGVMRRKVVEAVKAAAWVATVMVELVPIVFRTIGIVAPVFGPDMTKRLKPLRSRARLSVVAMVVVVPPVAAIEEAPAVGPALQFVPATAAPAATVAVSAGDGSCTHPSPSAAKMWATFWFDKKSAICRTLSTAAISDPETLATGHGVTHSHRFWSRMFRLP